MRRRELLRTLLTLGAAPALLSLSVTDLLAQEIAPIRPLPDGAPSAPTSPLTAPAAGDAAPGAAPESAQGPLPNNIVGLNVARLHQPLYIWAASDLVNANGGDWGYITVVWTMADREARNAELNLQLFLDRCFEFHLQPIVRVATRFEARREPAVEGQPPVKPNSQGAEGTWMRPDWDEPKKWREFFELGRWPTRHAWIIVGNEPNLGREWGGAVDAADYARYLSHFLDVFADAPRFDVVSGALDISNTTALPVMQDALEFLDAMGAAVPGLFERLPAWASNPYHVPSAGSGVRYTHLAYEAEFDRIGREMPVLITEAGHLQTGDEQEIARFYEDAFRDWMADPKVVAATPLFWHPDRNDFWMFELDKKGAFIHKSATYELMRRLPRVAGSPNYAVALTNTARTTPFEVVVAAESPVEGELEPTPQQRLSSTRPGDTGELEGSEAGTAAPPRRDRRPPSETEASGPPKPGEEPEPPASGQVPGQASTAAQPAAGQPAASTTTGSATATETPARAWTSTTARTRNAGMAVLRVVNTGGQGARLRAAPSRAADSITVLPDGAVVQALGPESMVTEESWRHVRASDGMIGWVLADLLSPTAAEDE